MSDTNKQTPKSLNKIKGLVFKDSTIRRIDVIGTGFLPTWTSDDRQLIAVADGASQDEIEAYHSRIFALKGDPTTFALEALPGYPHMQLRIKSLDQASYWARSCLAVDDTVYQFLMTTNQAFVNSDGSFPPEFRPIGTKLIYSPDNGVTWHNQDGSTPVRWENWNSRSKDNMLFYDEGIEADSFLQMGQAYRANKDGYVYVYTKCKGSSSELTLLRVRKSRILERGAYECFAGRLANGEASWSREVHERAAAHRFPEGWVATKNSDGVVEAGWTANVVYNEPLGVYILVAQGQGSGADGGWFGKPSYLGFWVAETPWGPFKQIHEETAWAPNGDAAARGYKPVIAPKWIAPDGKSFWFFWSDYRYQGAKGETQNPDKDIVEIAKDIGDDKEFSRVFIKWTRVHQPEGVGHVQRADLVVE